MQLSGTVNVWCGARTFLLYDRIVIARVTKSQHTLSHGYWVVAL